ncbi:hypothetical protein CBA19CS11_30755 [Caballeronia novacaledonica]|nr:hypothetical protein CBA19CS11_30755 [Caballeronia novacaledonica]
MDEDPIPLLVSFAVGGATVVDPTRRIAISGAVDHATVVEIEKESMSILRRRPLDSALRFLCRDDLALVLDDRIAGGDVGERENASTMDQRGPNCNATHGVFSQGSSRRNARGCATTGIIAHHCMPGRQDMPAPTRRTKLKRKPARGTLVRYQDRIAEVMGEARGQRVMIRSIHPDGQERRTAVKWVNLVPLETQLF